MTNLTNIINSLNEIIHEVQATGYTTTNHIEKYQIAERDWMFVAHKANADFQKIVADRMDQVRSYLNR